MNLVLYLTGSLNKNIAEAFGIHGYSYQEVTTKPKKINDFFTTKEGYAVRSEFTETTETVEPIDFFDFCYQGKSDTGFSQINALLELDHYFSNQEVNSILIHTEGRHLIHLLENSLPNWKSKQWLDANNQPIPCKLIWEQVDNFLSKYQVNFKWYSGVKGFGERISDTLYEVAVNGGEYKNYQTSPLEEYRNTDVEKHPFISSRRLIFSNSEQNDRGNYYLAESGIKGKKEEAFGKRLPAAAYTVIHLTEPCEVIETVKSSHRVLSRGEVCPVIMKLDNIFDKSVYPFINKYGIRSVKQYDTRSNNLDFINKTNLSMELLPVGLSLNAISNFSQMEYILDTYQNSSDREQNKTVFNLTDGMQIIDITDTFYDTTVKKEVLVKTLKGIFGVGSKLVTIPIETIFNSEKISLKIPIVLGLDLIPRNNLKRIESMNPKILLVLCQEQSLLYRYHCIVECNTGIGIWSNFFSNRVVAKAAME